MVAISERVLLGREGLVVDRAALGRERGLRTTHCALCAQAKAETEAKISMWTVPAWIGLAAVFAYGLIYRFAVHTAWGTWDTFLLLSDRTRETALFVAFPFAFPLLYVASVSVLAALAFGRVKLTLSSCHACARRQRRARRSGRALRWALTALTVIALLVFPGAVRVPVPLVGLLFLPLVFVERFLFAQPMFSHVVRLRRAGKDAVELHVPPECEEVLTQERPEVLRSGFPEEARSTKILRAVAPALVLLQVVQLTVRHDFLSEPSAVGTMPVRYLENQHRMRGGLLPSGARHGLFLGLGGRDGATVTLEEGFLFGRMHGLFRERSDHGVVLARGEYRFGRPAGRWTFAAPDATWEEALPDVEAGAGDWQRLEVKGEARLMCPAGTDYVGKRAGARGCLDAEGKLQGPFLNLAYNGRLMSASLMRDGEYDGPSAELSSSGLLTRLWTYRAGKLHGETFTFEPGPPLRLSSVERFVDGFGSGASTFHPSGGLRYFMMKREGISHGLELSIDNTGTLYAGGVKCKQRNRGPWWNLGATDPTPVYDDGGRVAGKWTPSGEGPTADPDTWPRSWRVWLGLVDAAATDLCGEPLETYGCAPSGPCRLPTATLEHAAVVLERAWPLLRELKAGFPALPVDVD